MFYSTTCSVHAFWQDVFVSSYVAGTLSCICKEFCRNIAFVLQSSAGSAMPVQLIIRKPEYTPS